MSLADALREARAWAASPAPPMPKPKLPAIVAELDLLWSRTPTAPTAATVAEIAGRFREAFAQRRYHVLQRRDWRMLPWALWYGDAPLAADPLLLDVYEQRLRTEPRRSEVKGLIGAYLRDFASHQPNLDRIARLVARLCKSWDWPWNERQRRLALFIPGGAPERLAEACLAAAEPPAAVLTALGMPHDRHTGLPLAALLHAIERLRRALSNDGPEAAALLPKVMTWAVDQGEIIPGARGLLADALLLPWCDRQPPASVKEAIQPFLLRHYGDPRIRPATWQSVAGDARLVFQRWLVGIAFDQFFHVIDRLALEHHWKFRKAFWGAYLRRELVHDARALLGPGCAELAAVRSEGRASFARLESGNRKPVESTHAVLLMRIGSLTIADWSHNGRLVIWPDGDRQAPSLDRASYTSDLVYADRGPFRLVHAGAPSYSWQTKARDYIHAQTGIWLDADEFAVTE